MSKILDGGKFGFGIILAISLFGVVFASGFHTANQIVDGTFNGNFTFNGSIDLENASLTGVSRQNYFINGGFRIWQRGSSISIGSVYTFHADRWGSNGKNGAGDVTRQSFTIGQTNVSGEPEYFLRMSQTTSASDGVTNVLGQRVEGVRTLAEETITMSFYAKANQSLTLTPRVRQEFGSSGSSSVTTTASENITLTTSWQKFEINIDIPSISSKTISGGDDHLHTELIAQINQQFQADFSQMKLEKGSGATEFEPRPIAEELALCQRYYEKSYNIDIAPGTSTYTGSIRIYYVFNEPWRRMVYFKESKRAIPTITYYNPADGTLGEFTYDFGNASTSATLDEAEGHSSFVIGTNSALSYQNVNAHWIADAEFN